MLMETNPGRFAALPRLPHGNYLIDQGRLGDIVMASRFRQSTYCVRAMLTVASWSSRKEPTSLHPTSATNH